MDDYKRKEEKYDQSSKLIFFIERMQWIQSEVEITESDSN